MKIPTYAGPEFTTLGKPLTYFWQVIREKLKSGGKESRIPIIQDRKSYAQQAIDRWFSNPNRHRSTVLGQTVKMIFEKLIPETQVEGELSQEEAAEMILNGLSDGTTKQEVNLKNKRTKG